MSQVRQPAVREALHVPASSNFFDGDNGAGMVYRNTEPDLRPFYQHVANSTALRVLVYNGDTDPAINSFVAQAQNACGCSLSLIAPSPHQLLHRAHVFGMRPSSHSSTYLAYLLRPSRPLLPTSCLSYRTGPRTWALQPRSRGVRGPSTDAAVWVAT